jgi:hypothetical protein
VLGVNEFEPGVGVAVGEPLGVGEALAVGDGDGLGPGRVRTSANTTNAGVAGTEKAVVPAANDTVLPLRTPVDSVVKPAPALFES